MGIFSFLMFLPGYKAENSRIFINFANIVVVKI